MKSWGFSLIFVLLAPIFVHSISGQTNTLTNGERMANQYGSMQSTTYPNVELEWSPTQPTAGQDVTFSIVFVNPGSSMPRSHIDYTFTILKEAKTVYTVSKHTHSGTDTIKQKLAVDGVHKITITITGINFNKVSPRPTDFSIDVGKTPTQEEKQQEPVLPPAPSKEEVPIEPKIDAKVQAKQIRDIIIIRVRNMEDSTTDVYSFKISIADSPLKASRGPKGWDKEALIDTVTFSTVKEPLRPGEKQFFILRVDATKPLIQWKVLGSDVNIMVEGSLTPLIR